MVTNGIYVKEDQPEEGLFNQWYTVEFVSFNEFHIDFCNVTDTTTLIQAVIFSKFKLLKHGCDLCLGG